MHIICFVGGLGTSRRYFSNLTSILDKLHNVVYFVYTLEVNGTYEVQVSKLTEYLTLNVLSNNTYIVDQISILGFSTGSMILLESLSTIETDFEKIQLYFVNPANFFIDVYNDKSLYFFEKNKYNANNTLILSNKSNQDTFSFQNTCQIYKLLYYWIITYIPYSKTLLSRIYHLFVGHALNEPVYIMEDIFNFGNPHQLIQFIKSNLFDVNVYDKVRHSNPRLKRIKIISGTKDRYKCFSHLLAEYFPHKFKDVTYVNGNHHILYQKPYHVIKEILYVNVI